MANHLSQNLSSRVGCTCWAHSAASNAAVPVFAEVGCRWVRSTWSLHFDLISTAPRVYDFASHGEDSINRLIEQGMSVMGILDGRWGHEMERNTAPWSSPIWRHLDLWEDFVAHTVDYYKDRIRFWEILNEPPFFWLYPDPEGVAMPKVNPPRRRAPIWAYADLLKSSARAIRDTDPEARIVVGSGFSDGTFLKRLYELGCREAFDVASVHYLSCKHPEEFGRGYRRLRTVMAAYGDEAKPLWDTESGPGGAVIGLAVETPAEYEALYNIYRHCFAHQVGLERYFWFNPVGREGVNRDSLPPAYRAIKSLTSLVGDGRLLHHEHPGNEVHLYVFEGPGGPISIVWSTAPATARIPGGAEATTHLGAPTKLPSEFPLTGRPLFVRGDLTRQGFDGTVTGPRETVVACWENKRPQPHTSTFVSPRVEGRAAIHDLVWSRLEYLGQKAHIPLVQQQDHFCLVSSSVTADVQMAHNDDYLFLRVRTYDDRVDPHRPSGLVQFTLRDENPDIHEWAYFYNSYALFNLYGCPRGPMFLRFDPLLPDEYPAGRVETVKVTVEAMTDGLLFWARIPWEELGPCRPGRHNPFYMMFAFHRADGLLEVPAGDTPEEWPHNFNDAFIVKAPALARWVKFG